MPEVVVPLGIQPVATTGDVADETRVIEVALGDHTDGPAEPKRVGVERRPELLEDVDRRPIEDLVDGVEPECVDVVRLDPVARVVDHEPAHLDGARTVEVERLPPGCPVPLAEVRAIPGEIVAIGAEVVVDDVEDDRQTAPVAGVDEVLQPVGAAERVMRREQVDAVVAPTTIARELHDRQELDVGDPERHEVIEPLDRGIERATLRERPDVELVENRVGERARLERLVVPGERVVVDESGQPVHAVRLRCRAGVRKRSLSVEQEAVVGARPRLGDDERPPVAARARHRATILAGSAEGELDARGSRRPHAECRHVTSRSSTATGNRPSRSASRRDPPSIIPPASASRHLPGGSSTVAAGSTGRPGAAEGRGTTTTASSAAPPRLNAKAGSGSGPAALRTASGT